MSNQQPQPANDWQWNDAYWTDSPTAPTSPEDVPDTHDRDGWSAGLRRLLRWAARP